MDETELTVAGVDRVGPDAITVTIESPQRFAAKPGQFVKLTLDVEGEDVSRFYTVSSPDVEDTFEITVEIDPEGDVGPALAELESGDEVRVSGPFGSDFYEGEDPVLVLAGGPGVGPAIAIAERAHADGHEATIVYRDDEHIHEDRIASFREAGGTVAVLDADEELTDAVATAYAEYENPQLFVYGFADFIDAATSAIEAADGDTSTAKIENFG